MAGVIFLLFTSYSAYLLRVGENGSGLNIFLFVTVICIFTDIGGYTFGKLFKGPKLINISPNKTYSGMIGSFVFSAIGYTIALRTGNVQATQSAFVIFFPFLFLTSSLVPIEAFDGWFKVATNLNPVTYVLEGCRSLLTPIFEFEKIIKAILTIVIVGTVTISSSFIALNKRII